MMNIRQGMREMIIENTPTDYYKLYTDCLNGDPEKRPIIEDVYDKLNMLPNRDEFITTTTTTKVDGKFL